MNYFLIVVRDVTIGSERTHLLPSLPLSEHTPAAVGAKRPTMPPRARAEPSDVRAAGVRGDADKWVLSCPDDRYADG